MKRLPKLMLTALLAGTLLSTPKPSEATVLGGLDLQRYCTRKVDSILGVGTGSFSRPILVGNNPTALSWRCRYYFNRMIFGPLGWDYGMDMNEACRWQYGGRAFATTSNTRDPYSWRCRR